MKNIIFFFFLIGFICACKNDNKQETKIQSAAPKTYQASEEEIKRNKDLKNRNFGIDPKKSVEEYELKSGAKNIKNNTKEWKAFKEISVDEIDITSFGIFKNFILLADSISGRVISYDYEADTLLYQYEELYVHKMRNTIRRFFMPNHKTGEVMMYRGYPEIKAMEPSYTIENPILARGLKVGFYFIVNKNKIYVEKDGVIEIEPKGKFAFKNIIDMAFINDKIYVLDQGDNMIKVFSISGNFLGHFASEQMVNPNSLAILEESAIMISDGDCNCIHNYDLSGNFIESFNLSEDSLKEISSQGALLAERINLQDSGQTIIRVYK